MRNKQFYIEAVKMDLLRLVSQVSSLDSKISQSSVKIFLDHALTDLDTIQLNKHELRLKQELIQIGKDLENYLNDPIKRLRWAEKVLTIRCRL